MSIFAIKKNILQYFFDKRDNSRCSTYVGKFHDKMIKRWALILFHFLISKTDSRTWALFKLYKFWHWLELIHNIFWNGGVYILLIFTRIQSRSDSDYVRAQPHTIIAATKASESGPFVYIRLSARWRLMRSEHLHQDHKRAVKSI